MRLLKVLTIIFYFSVTLMASDALPSWNSGKTKNSIINFVQAVTDKSSSDFVDVQDRIAVFDNDGTLWSEQPVFFQLFFAIDQVRALAPEHPKWKTTQPFKAALEGDIKALMATGKEGILKLMMATSAGMSSEDFNDKVINWIKTAKHPTKNIHYDELVFQPMLELLDYLRLNGFKIFIVSGGGIDFMRSWASEVYGIHSSQVIGSKIEVKYENKDIIRVPKVRFVDNNEGKVISIHYHIGKRPIAAFGNSDGDFAMMEYTEANKNSKTLQLFVHHTDKKREWAYDRKSDLGKFDKGLDYAKEHNWTIVDMKNDWKVIYPFELKK